MNRTGLAITLVVAVAVGVLFAIYPQFDLGLAGLFFNPAEHLFVVSGNQGAQSIWQSLRHLAEGLITVLVAPAVLAICGKLILTRRRMLIGGRAALFLAVTLALGPGLIANVLLKDHWGRPRPIDVTEFGGADPFVPWWNPRGPCPTNCSFIAGEPSGAFWTLAPAALAPPQWRVLAYGGALAFGAGVGVLRMAAGGHFFTDVVFAGVFMYLLVWAMHGLIFRWRATRIADDAVERPLARVGVAMRGGLARLGRLFGGRNGKPS
jgi:membrane-associated PAP2 superfamily phosphatase